MVKQERVPIIPLGHGENIEKIRKGDISYEQSRCGTCSHGRSHESKRQSKKRFLIHAVIRTEKNARIDKRSPLTEEEADAVVKKEIKQTKETLELAPADRADIREEAQARLAVYQEFAPEDLTEEQIAEVIKCSGRAWALKIRHRLTRAKS